MGRPALHPRGVSSLANRNFTTNGGCLPTSLPLRSKRTKDRISNRAAHEVSGHKRTSSATLRPCETAGRSPRGTYRQREDDFAQTSSVRTPSICRSLRQMQFSPAANAAPACSREVVSRIDDRQVGACFNQLYQPRSIHSLHDCRRH